MKKNVWYISQLADPNIINTHAFQQCPGGDNEINWIISQLKKLNLWDEINFQGVSIERGGELPEIDQVDIAFLGGSYHSVHDHYPWQQNLQKWLGHYHATKKPMLGICGGHQQLAMYLGMEIIQVAEGTMAATLPIHLTEAGQAHFLFKNIPVDQLYFHFGNSQQVATAPEGATIIARRPEMAAMALDYGQHWYSVQFHPEAEADIFSKGWLATHPQYCDNYTPTPYAPKMLENFLRAYL